MLKSPATERFHALDATRAFALLLGVVFHAAWSFIPRGAGAPVTDVSSHIGFDWFFFTSHTFRMQVFFLIAGFFARLMYHKRGFSGFAKNRLSRIAVPLVAGWLILVPLTLLTWAWGANVSGKNLTEAPLSFLLQLMGKGLIFLPRSMGGMFGLAHLWFLYYLLWLYVLVLTVRFLLVRLMPARSSVREKTDRLVAWCVDSPWSVAGLALVTGLFLWSMGGWFGVDTPVHTLRPSPAVLLLYGFFFALGWLMHRQTHLLREFGRRWHWQLSLGLILSVGLYAAFHRVEQRGAAGGIFSSYPTLSPAQVSDWPAFLNRLRSPATDSNAAVGLRQLWHSLPPTSQSSLVRLPETPSIDARIGVCQAINKNLVYPELFEPETLDSGGERLPIERRLVEPALAERTQMENRRRLEALFPATLRSDPRGLAWYWPGKLLFSLSYALVMWLLVFATLGFFQERCTKHSPAWRYVADSSYWVYLAHIPLIPWLQVWMADWPWPGLLKFLLLNVVGFLLLYASYHYLVRSTFIGKVLNGRRYPFVPFPWRPSGDRDDSGQAAVPLPSLGDSK